MTPISVFSAEFTTGIYFLIRLFKFALPPFFLLKYLWVGIERFRKLYEFCTTYPYIFHIVHKEKIRG